VSTARIDVSGLPEHVFDGRALVWWANATLIAIESTTFAMAFWTYFYLRSVASEWPPSGTPVPPLAPGIAGVALLLASCLPFHLAGKEAIKGPSGNRRTIRWGLFLNIVLVAGFLGIRWIELRGLGCRWDSHAYGSAAWAIFVLHGAESLAALLETGVVLAAFTLQEPRIKDFTDVRADGLFWYFLVGAGVASAAVVYLAPRFL